MNPLLRRLLFNATPLLLMAGVIFMAIFGEDGLIRRHNLRLQYNELMAKNEALECENEWRRQKIKILKDRPEGIRRLLDEELLMAPEGSTLYRFEDELNPTRDCERR